MRNIKKAFVGLMIILSFPACIETYDFEVKNQAPGLVIESFLSNVSFDQSLNFPSDGRQFYVRLSYTSDVKNVRDEIITQATISLHDDAGNEWSYAASVEKDGMYYLSNLQFQAVEERAYKLRVILADETYESNWQTLPSASGQPLGGVTFEETTEVKYVYGAGKKEVRSVDGIEVSIALPVNNSNEEVFYRWDFDPLWVFIPPLRTERKCWLSSASYLNGFKLQKDIVGGYDKKLFFLEIENNAKVYFNFSTLISQQVISKEYFNFWTVMNNQSANTGLFEPPPANLPTNFSCTSNPNNFVVGYFGISNEQTRRWYFSIEDLSYYHENDLEYEMCTPKDPPPRQEPPPPECYDCLVVPNTTATDEQPDWWIQN